MSSEAIATWVVAGLGLLAIVATIVKLTWRNFRRIDIFLDDWEGRPERPGVPAQPGVMSRLKNVENATDLLRNEISFNSGHSVKDAVHRIDETVQAMQIVQAQNAEIRVENEREAQS